MKLALALVLAVVSAGCAQTAAPPVASTPAAPPSASGPEGNATTPPGGLPTVGARGPVVTERFWMSADHKLVFADPAAGEPALGAVPETFTGSSFFTADPGAAMKPWVGPPSLRAFEALSDVSFTLRFSATQAGASPGLLPTVGAWLGGPDRWAVFLTAPDAPQTIEAGKVYTLKMTAKMPEGGLFVRPGETLALHPYLSYQTADGSPLSYVVGGPDAAGIVLPHVHFDLHAPNASVILDKSGAFDNNPLGSTTQDPKPTDLEFVVPADVAYLVAELTGTPAAAGGLDADLTMLGGGATLGSSTGPTAHEVVELGPTALAKAGGKMVAHVAGASAGGGAWRLVVTAYR